MTKANILGGLSYQAFLKKYWQKKPLLIRKAFPNFQSFIHKNDLFKIAADECQPSRLISFNKKKWQLQEGPFKKTAFKDLPERWTLLVQGINEVHQDANALLQQFNFIPYARLDDVMVSYATEGAGVGPHVDSYDVFLLQGQGRRLWQISNQKELELKKNLPLKILKKFHPSEEWILEPGDMLYLPPQYAHNGIAMDESMTYSIGFRAPSYQELIVEFLGFLQESCQVSGIYQDPDLKYTTNPGELSKQMLDKVMQILHQIKFDNKMVERFLGSYLTMPKPTQFFDASSRKKSDFITQIKKYGLALDPKSQMLYTKNAVFLNGEYNPVNHAILKQLANHKKTLITSQLDKKLMDLLYRWYLEGYVQVGYDNAQM